MIGGLFEDDVLPAGKFVKDSWLIMEVDESDGTIDGYSPEGTLALNCDWDHVDRYAGPNAFPDTVRSLFTRSADALIVPKGSNLENWAMEIAKSKVRSFKVPEDPADFLLFNTNAAIAAGEYLGENLSSVDFSKFPGIKRRQSFLYRGPNRSILEDYAHHPTEIRSFLSQRRIVDPDSLMKVVFQPHRYSRTKSTRPAVCGRIVDCR